jgi:predicted ATPase
VIDRQLGLSRRGYAVAFWAIATFSTALTFNVRSHDRLDTVTPCHGRSGGSRWPAHVPPEGAPAASASAYRAMRLPTTLPKCEWEAMIDGVAGNKLIPASIRQDIIERTDGIPLFVEEMTKAVVESRIEGVVQQKTVASFPSRALAVPASLQASLMARLDRLGPAKKVAQVGAAIGREFSHALLSTVVSKSELELASALDSLVETGLLFRQGIPPHASYLFKHALVQDAAYGTLLREPRRALHARIAEAVESQFTETAENQPELIARHCAEAGLIEKAAVLWGKAGQRSLERSALIEAAEQFAGALDQINALPSTPTLYREQIKLQVGLANALMHTKGRAAPETRASIEQARLLVERSQALGEGPDDPLVVFSIPYGFWNASFITFNGDALREVSAEILILAEKQGSTIPLMIGHRLMGMCLINAGEITPACVHFDKAMALYDPAAHRALATRFGQDVRVAILAYRSVGVWMLGNPEAALADADQALRYARDAGQATTLMYALGVTSLTHIVYGNYAAAKALLDELASLVGEMNALHWKGLSVALRGWLCYLTGKASDAVPIMVAGIAAYRSTAATQALPALLSRLASAYAEIGKFEDSRRCIDEATMAVETTKERWWETEVNRIAGEIALKSPEADISKAEAYFERALAVAREQQAKSWELRAAMSMARLWRYQGKGNEARELLAPVYGWFTEGFDTRDLKEAKALLDELSL